MPLLPVEKFIEKITFLERTVGKEVGYQTLEPFRVSPADAVAVQRAAKQIGDFVGLKNLVFVVGFTEQDEKTAAHIELQTGEQSVFIEVSPDVLRFEDSLLATLAHEITHKYMHVHRITSGAEPVEIETEILTDICAVFLGLGKLMLNGSESKVTRTEPKEGGTETTTESFNCGYLDRDQLALTYLLICTMRKIPPANYESGMTSEARIALAEAYRLHVDYLNGHLHEKTGKEEYQQRLSCAIQDSQIILAGIERNLLYVRGAYEPELERFLEQAHKRLKDLQAESAHMFDESQFDPCLRFLSAVQDAQRVKSLIQQLRNGSRERQAHDMATRKLSAVVKDFGNEHPLQAHDLLGVVTCRVDGTTLRVPLDKDLVRVRCPGCQYDFPVITSRPNSGSTLSGASKSLWRSFSRIAPNLARQLKKKHLWAGLAGVTFFLALVVFSFWGVYRATQVSPPPASAMPEGPSSAEVPSEPPTPIQPTIPSPQPRWAVLPPCANGKLPQRLLTGEEIVPSAGVSGAYELYIKNGTDDDALVRLSKLPAMTTSRLLYIRAKDSHSVV